MAASKPSATTTVVTWTFAAPRQAVFDALTHPAHVPAWLQSGAMKLVLYETDLRAGGAFRYVFERSGGKRMEMGGVYLTFDPPGRWANTETYDFSPLALRVENALDEADGLTLLTQTIHYPTTAERDDDFDGVAASSAEAHPKLERYLAERL